MEKTKFCEFELRNPKTEFSGVFHWKKLETLDIIWVKPSWKKKLNIMQAINIFNWFKGPLPLTPTWPQQVLDSSRVSV